MAPAKLRCPRCGEAAQRTWNDVFVLNLATLLIFGALAPFMLPFFTSLASVLGGVLVLVWAGIVLISLFALPVVGSMSVVSRVRCRVCGYRFWPVSGVQGSGGDTGFPVRLALVASAIVLVSLGIGFIWVMSSPGRETWAAGFMVVKRIIMAALALGIGVFAQAVLWRMLCTRTGNAVWQSVVLLAPALVLSAGWLILSAHDCKFLHAKYDPLVRAPQVLVRAQLAQLPESASGVAVHIFSFIGSAKYFLRFAAEPDEIERFLENSPSLKEVTYQRYSKERMRIASVEHADVFNGPRDRQHEYFYPKRDAPPWYKQEIRGAGRRYEINPGAGNWRGELVVDDERHVVYVHLCRY